MLKYGLSDAKRHFSKIITQVSVTHEICVISKYGRDVALISPINKNKTRKIGLSKGKFVIPEDFDAPLPDDIINSFYKDKF